jgi:uncharacterized protein YecE (DUF72 family)
MRGTSAELRIGCAGWAIPRASSPAFPAAGTHLQRYAARLTGVEINSSFYRPHRPATYAKWAAAAPAGFQFAVKVPKEVTHVRRLVDVEDVLLRFLGECTALGPSLGPLLVQLPPSLGFDPAIADAFFAVLREHHTGAVVCEPRHPTWFTPAAQRMLRTYRLARVAADPAPVPAAAEPGGWDGLVYYRLHGSPEMYRSAYAPAYLDRLALTLRRCVRGGVPAWCIFDNTAEGAATADALGLLARVTGERPEEVARVGEARGAAL